MADRHVIARYSAARLTAWAFVAAAVGLGVFWFGVEAGVLWPVDGGPGLMSYFIRGLGVLMLVSVVVLPVSVLAVRGRAVAVSGKMLEVIQLVPVRVPLNEIEDISASAIPLRPGLYLRRRGRPAPMYLSTRLLDRPQAQIDADLRAAWIAARGV